MVTAFHEPVKGTSGTILGPDYEAWYLGLFSVAVTVYLSLGDLQRIEVHILHGSGKSEVSSCIWLHLARTSGCFNS
jgi:hypothetical protein